MKILLKLDERDCSMVLMYVGEYLLGAAHVDCFDDLETPIDEYGARSSMMELLQEFTEVETDLKIVDLNSYKIGDEL